MTDKFKNVSTGLESPPSRLFAIVPDNDADLALVTRVINVAAAGTVKVTTVDGDEDDVFIAAGIPFPIRARRVWATGTTATGIRGLT
ncbi:hypothetical protein KX928_23415 [Roseobacter sp. YSTF-M11]|uniref:Uncharacterized protein n=1 Tax=Roseobacter insulae TaxID=2859783 RepID=A0A9X1FYW8_9RHOB|nr:hypothetical protein [Roseobacter insulae]MBW4710750.1 hypothetical protein [Roseobacter insulae]